MPRLVEPQADPQAPPSGATAPAEATATPKPKKPRAPRKKKEATAPTPPPPPPPTECVDCRAPLTWRDAFYVPERGRRRCKRCFARLERERVEKGLLVTPAPNTNITTGANRATLRASGVRSGKGHYRLQLDLAPTRPKTQSNGRRSHKRTHVPCLCCVREPHEPRETKKGAA